MLKNKDLQSEVFAIVKSSGIGQVGIADALGVSRQSVQNAMHRKMVGGDELWIQILDEAGYDVEVKIRKKKTI